MHMIYGEEPLNSIFYYIFYNISAVEMVGEELCGCSSAA